MVLEETPSKELVLKLVGKRIYSKSYKFGVLLGINTNALNALRKDNPHDLEEYFIKLCSNWLNREEGTGDKPRTWRTVIEAVRECEYPEVADRAVEQLILECKSRTGEYCSVQNFPKT